MSATESKIIESLEKPTLPEEGKPQGDPVQSEKIVDNGGQVDEEDEEEGECGFCLFMKAGGCKESFVAWEQCIADAEKNKEDSVDKCYDITGALRKCMEAHSDYYEPILKAEKAAQEEVVKELEKGKEAAPQNAGTKNSESQGNSDDKK